MNSVDLVVSLGLFMQGVGSGDTCSSDFDSLSQAAREKGAKRWQRWVLGCVPSNQTEGIYQDNCSGRAGKLKHPAGDSTLSV